MNRDEMMDNGSGRALREAALSPSATEPVPVSSLSGNDQPRGLLELAERIEALSWPDREVDKEVLALVGAFTKGGLPTFNGGIGYPAFTASLDDALSLMPKDWKLRQINASAPCADDRKWHVNLHGGREGEDTFVGRGAWYSLALCAAALRARAKETPDAE